MPYYPDREAWRAERNHRIAEMIAEGHTHAEIGRRLNISGPAVTHWISGSPELRHLRRNHTARRQERLYSIRRELEAIRAELQSLQRQVRKTAQELDEEAATIDLDRQLGLR